MMLLAMAGISLIAPTAQAVTAADGDLFLGVRASGGTGAAKNYVVNLGPSSQFTGTSAITFNLGDVGSDLNSTFGSDWNTRANVFWGVAGTSGGGTPTVFASRKQLTVGTQSSPWLRESNTSNSFVDSKLQSMMNGFRAGDATGLDATNAVSQQGTDANAWATFQPGGLPFSSNQGISFARWNPSIEGNFANGTSGSVLDLYSLAPGSVGTAGDYLGRLVMSDAGEVTFVPVAAIGGGSVMAFSSLTSSTIEDVTTFDVTITRTGDVTATASVNVAVTGGSAASPADFSFTGGTVSFAVGQASATTTLTVVNRPGNQGDRTVALGLSSPVGGTVGAISATTVTIQDAVVPSEINLAATDIFVVGGPSSTSVTLSFVRSGGTAPVSVDISTANGTALAGVDYTAVSGQTVNFATGETTASATITLAGVAVASTKTFSVILTNPSGSASLGALNTASVNIVPPATSGSLTATVVGSGNVTGIRPGPTAYVVGKTYTLTATPGTGFVFDHWSGPGLTAPSNELAKLTFVYTAQIAASPVFTATFVSNPFVPTEIGSFCGLVQPDVGTDSTNSTNGFMKLALSAKGAFSGSLQIDGFTLKVAGLFANDGSARFGTARTNKVLVERGTKPAVELSNVAWNSATDTISGTVTQYLRKVVIAESIFTLKRAAFAAKVPVQPASYTANGGKYTVIIPTEAQTNGLTSEDFPQGDGSGLITITTAGAVKLVGKLADGTPFTASTTLASDLSAPLFVQLYSKKGSFSAAVQLDDSDADSDLSATDCAWFRPWQNKQQHYPWGWEEGVTLDLMGAKYVVTKGASVLPSGAATLEFSDGLLSTTVTKTVDIASTNKVTPNPATDKSFSVVITATTGDVKGNFTNPDTNAKTSFEGKVYQKGTNAGAYGFFLSAKPKVIDGLGESGGFSLNHN